MLNLSNYSNNHDDFFYSELKSLEHPKVKNNRLPRHISSLESPKHLKIVKSNLLNTSLYSKEKPNKMAEESNLAVKILTYQLKDKAAQQKHIANLRSNLQRRFEVAKAAQDSQLMIMLQEEFRQLSTI